MAKLDYNNHQLVKLELVLNGDKDYREIMKLIAEKYGLLIGDPITAAECVIAHSVSFNPFNKRNANIREEIL